jgi:glycosyltransferase involved in cell wall biosynthesis
MAGLNSSMDLSILSSNTEGLPNVILEEMLSGLPFVGTDIPGIREAVYEENYKYLSKPKDFKELANNILIFANDQELRKEVGQKNKQLIIDNFGFKRMCEETNKIILKNLIF